MKERGQATPTGWELVDDIRATVQELEPNTRAEGALYTEGLDQVEELADARSSHGARSGSRSDRNLWRNP